MRGFFHDFQTSDIEGSILWETHMHFNGGLCKWGQYVNALSDTTGCDPGTIIQSIGQCSPACTATQLDAPLRCAPCACHADRPHLRQTNTRLSARGM